MEPYVFTINQTYTIYHNIHSDEWSLILLMALLSIAIPLCSLICASMEHYLLLKRKTNNMFPVTSATEVIYECFDRHSLNKEIIDLILFEFCGYADPPQLEAVLLLHQQTAQKCKELLQTDTARLIKKEQNLWRIVLACILMATLVFCSFHGIILLIRTHEYNAKYSIHFQCELLDDTEDDICKVIGYYNHDIWQNETEFHDEILLPYLEENEGEAMNDSSSNTNLLHLSLNGVDILTSIAGYVREGKIDIDKDYECCPMEGDLYLSPKGLNHSDFRIKTRAWRDIKHEGCCNKHADHEWCCGCTCYECGAYFSVFSSVTYIILIMCGFAYFSIPTNTYLQEVVLWKEVQSIIESIHYIDLQWADN